jgi:hypothetical protein
MNADYCHFVLALSSSLLAFESSRHQTTQEVTAEEDVDEEGGDGR